MVDFPTQLYRSYDGQGVQIGDNKPIPITYTSPPENLIDISIPGAPVPANIDVRARAYHYSLGSSSPGLDVINSRIQTPGGDAGLRQEYSRRAVLDLENRRRGLVQEYMRQRPTGQYDRAEISHILGMASRDIAEAERDPSTFFERAFARRVTEATPPEATRPINSGLQWITEGTQRVVANREYAQRRLEESIALMGQQEGARTSQDLSQAVIPGTSWYRMTNIIGNRAAMPNSFLLGNNLREQIDHYYSLPPDQAAKALDEAIKYLREGKGNSLRPGLRGSEFDTLLFLQVVASPSTAEIHTANIASILDLFTPFGNIFRIGSRQARLLDRVVPPTSTLTGTAPTVVDEAARARAAAGIADIARQNAETGIAGLARSMRDAFQGRPMGMEEVAAARTQRDVANAAMHDGRPSAMQEAGGDLLGAAITRNAESAQDLSIQAANRTGNIDSFDQIRNEVRALYDVPGILKGSHLTRANELALRVQLERQANELLNATMGSGGIIDIVRPGGLAQQYAATNARAALHQAFPHIADRVIDVNLEQATRAVARGLSERLRGYPEAVRPAAEAAHNALLPIYQKNLGQRYSAWRKLNEEIKRALEEVSTLTQTTFDVPKVLRGMASGRGGQFPNKSILADGQEHINELNRFLESAKPALRSFSPEERKLFLQADTFATRYEKAAAKIGYEGRFPLPNDQALERLAELQTRQEIVKGLGNTDWVQIRLSDKDGTLFNSEISAFRAAVEDLKLESGNIHIGRMGNGHYIGVRAPLNYSDDAVHRMIAIETQLDPTPRRWANDWINWSRSANYLVPKNIMDNMLTATYGTSAMQNMMQEMMNKTFGKLKFTNGERKEFVDFIEWQRSYRDQTTGERGVFSRDQLDFETAFYDRNGHYPTQSQSAAYWSMVQIMDIDYTMYNLMLYGDKVRMGYQLLGFGGNAPHIEGRVLNRMPGRSPKFNFGIVVEDRFSENVEHFYLNRVGDIRNGRTDARIKELQDKGYKLVQVNHLAAEDVRALPQFANLDPRKQIDFILTKELRVAPLQYKQIPRRGGVHHYYEHPYMLRQAKVHKSDEGISTYYGDISLHGINNAKEGAMWATRYETARQMVKQIMAGADNVRPQLAAYLDKHMPYKLDEFLDLFNGKGSLKLDVDQPIVLTPIHSRVAEHIKFDLDIRDKPHNMLNTANLRFAMERGEGLKNIVTTGTKEAPIYKLEQASMVDAMVSLTRANQSLMKGRYMGDLQTRTAYDFVNEFGNDTVRGGINLFDQSYQELMADPVRSLFQARFRDGVQDTHPEAYAAARDYQRVAREFHGLRSESERWMQTFERKLGQIVHGEPVNPTAPGIVNETNTVRALRNYSHYYFLMHPKQIFTQAMGIAHIIALEGPTAGTTRAFRAMPSALFSGFLEKTGRNSAIHIDEMGNRVARLGGNKEHFIEAHNELINSGFYHVGREYNTMSDFGKPMAAGTKATIRAVADVGIKPFKWGEQYVRYNAWHTSYLKWREANPDALFDAAGKRQVLSYADTLAVNMSAASRAGWQVNQMSAIPTTFWSYWHRVFEQMVSKDSPLTKTQVASAALTYGGLFGVGGAVGLFTFGVPTKQLLDRYLLDKGIAIDNNTDHFGIPGWAWNLVVNGVLNAATGEDFASAVGPGSNRVVTDLLKDKKFLELATGAFGSAVADVWGAANPFFMWTLGAFDTDGARLQPEDFYRILTVQPGISHGARVYMAFNTAKYYDRRGLPITDMNKMQATIFALTGVLPEDVSTHYNQLANEHSRIEAQRVAYREMQYWFNAMIERGNRGDHDGSQEAARRVEAARRAGGWLEQERPMLMRRLMRGNEDAFNRAMERYSRRSDDHFRVWESYRNRREGR